MKNKIITLVVLVVIFVIIGFLYVLPSRVTAPGSANNPSPSSSTAVDPKNATYIIDGVSVTLKNGVASVPAAPGSASMITTTYFGNAVTHDLNGDGRDDVAFLLTQNTGGSGTFYYVVAALNTPQGYIGSHAYLLGDRIAPQSTVMGKGSIVVVNYADRKPADSFAVAPSIGKTVWLMLDPTTLQFGNVEQDFSGEANPATMTLGMQKWNWVTTIYNDGTTVTPHKPTIFSLTFKLDGTFSASTDCNGVGGNYTLSGSTITLDRMISTQMYCDGSQESDFTKMLSSAVGYHFTGKGELVLDLNMDSGSMVFK